MAVSKPKPKNDITERANQAASYAESKHKSVDGETKRLNVILPMDLHVRFHRYAVDSRKTMTEILIELLERELP